MWQKCSARQLIEQKRKPLAPQKHKEEHKSHKYPLGFQSLLSIGFVTLCVLLCVFVAKRIFLIVSDGKGSLLFC
jgi:hypothetical protein